MNRFQYERSASESIWLLTVALLIQIGSAAGTTAADRPNIVIIITDDQGYSDVGYNGNPWLKTPVLDALASRSTVFNRFYAAPVCSPTRAGLMTGRYAFRTGVTDTQAGASILRPSETTIAEALRAHGYRTGLFGKWHLGDNAPARPIDQGFDHSLTHVGGMIGMSYNPQDGNSYFNPILIESGVEKRFRGYCVDVFADAAIDFIQSNDGRSFFVVFAPNTPHHPLTVPDRYAQPYRDAGLSEQTARYYGMITNIDDNVGKLLDSLKSVDAEGDTIVVFVGDNGTSSLHQQEDLWESGLRGRKSFVYENGIRVPMFIAVADGVETVDRVDVPAMVEDLMPTLLELCGIEPSVEFDGRSLVPLITGSTPVRPRRSMFFQFHRGAIPERYRHIAVISDPFKLVQPVGRQGSFNAADARYELYNLELDPNETRNIAGQNPAIVRSMVDEYNQWFDAVCAGGFEPVLTRIGEEVRETVTLTRQDWSNAGLFDGDLGVFHLDIRSAGTYRVTCRWGHLVDRTHPVTIKLNDRVIQKAILYAESECRIDRIELPQGEFRLEAWIEVNGLKSGFRNIQIERLN